ncbi:hypothetical protein AB0387_26425 [Streptomyces sp. NPDC089173]|uniref:hypothetical protein n=1 Tax=Streptomyces sp. NPDC089173 TaxID=3154965 RepID=UPI00344ED1E0
MNALARAGRAYWRENARAFQAIKVTVRRSPESVFAALMFVVAALLLFGFSSAALALAVGALAFQLAQWAVGR